MIKPRAFNTIKFDGEFAIKSPINGKDGPAAKKIYNEYLWLSSMRARKSLRAYVPDVKWDDDKKSLVMSRVERPTLAELYVMQMCGMFEFAKHTINGLFGLLALMKSEFENFAEAATWFGADKRKALFDGVCHELYVRKTDFRCAYLQERKGYIENTVFAIGGPHIAEHEFTINVDEMQSFIKAKAQQLAGGVQHLSIMHGDFCLSNIFDNFVMIDPRGSYGDKATIFGDARYDVAKLRHSIVGLYDYVKAGEYSLMAQPSIDPREHLALWFNDEPSQYDQIVEYFDKVVEESGYDLAEVKFIEALLFLTMVPLHKDSPKDQMALFMIGASKMLCCMEHDRLYSSRRSEKDSDKLRICFDLDGVICYVKDEHSSYEDCKPNSGVIAVMKQLHDAGHTIIIHTARGMGSSGQNAGMANAKVAKITLDWLQAHGVPYDEIYFGKPNAHVTIDDRCLRYDEAGKALTKEEILCKARLR